MSPPEDLQAALVAAESDADRSFDGRPVGSGVLPCGLTTHWVEFELLEDGAPAAGVRYELRLPGRVARGALNSRGRVRVEGITQSGACTITFPDVDAASAEGAGAESGEPTGDEADGEQSEESDGAEERGTLYVPGTRPEPVPLDESHCYRLPTWDLVALDLAAPAGAPAGGGPAAGQEMSEEEAEEQDDWDVTAVTFSDEA